jgi:hypothetical protein
LGWHCYRWRIAEKILVAFAGLVSAPLSIFTRFCLRIRDFSVWWVAGLVVPCMVKGSGLLPE